MHHHIQPRKFKTFSLIIEIPKPDQNITLIWRCWVVGKAQAPVVQSAVMLVFSGSFMGT